MTSTGCMHLFMLKSTCVRLSSIFYSMHFASLCLIKVNFGNYFERDFLLSQGRCIACKVIVHGQLQHLTVCHWRSVGEGENDAAPA